MATVARRLGALPTAILATSFRVCRSTIEQSLLPVFETHPYRPSREKAIQLRSLPTPIAGDTFPVLDVVNVDASCRHGGGPQFFAIRRKSQPVRCRIERAQIGIWKERGELHLASGRLE